MILDVKDFIKKICINLIMVIIWLVTAYFSYISKEITAINITIAIVWFITSIAIMYFGWKYTIDIMNNFKDRYKFSQSNAFGIIGSVSLFISLVFTIIIVAVKFSPNLINNLNDSILNPFMQITIPINIFSKNKLMFYALLIVFGSITIINIIYRFMNNKILYIIPILLSMLLCGSVITISTISFIIFLCEFLKELIPIFIIVFIAKILMSNNSESDKIKKDNSFNFSHCYTKNYNESEPYYLYSSGSNWATLKDSHGNQVNLHIFNREDGSMQDDSGNIYRPLN